MHINPSRNADHDPQDINDSDIFIENVPSNFNPQPAITDYANTSDVFATSRPGSPKFPGEMAWAGDAGMHELSELPRLQREHATNGYRDGVTAAKAVSIQKGFDEGFSLGAKFGKVAGKILGILREIDGALGDAEAPAKKKEVERLVREAGAELSVEKIFGAEFWNEDGTWKYEVLGEEGGDVMFEDVARAHPILRKWEKKVGRLMEEWSIRWSILGREGDENRTGEADMEKRVLKNIMLAGTAKSMLDW